ncbi:MAG: chemotaxis protein CheW [Gammaproteobacteria bacterium]|nr:chemotaxis protein CheW [Gammaproteobacteria bacterium]
MVDEIAKDDIEEEEFEQDQYLVFTIKSQEFGFRVLGVQEITSALGATEVPNAPAYVDGILNLRGHLVSVINFRKKLEFEPKERDEDTRIIIVEYGGFPVGIIVDGVEEVIKIPDEKVQKLPVSVTTSTSDEEEYITGVGMLDNRLIILMDVDKLLTKTELIEVDAIRQAMESSQTTEPLENDESNETGAVQTDKTVKKEIQRKVR